MKMRRRRARRRRITDLGSCNTHGKSNIGRLECGSIIGAIPCHPYYLTTMRTGLDPFLYIHVIHHRPKHDDDDDDHDPF